MAGSEGQRFYYYEGKPVLRLSGSERSCKGRSTIKNATGDKYCFTDGKLFAASSPDGKSIGVISAKRKDQRRKLQKESEAFSELRENNFGQSC
jgi:hypothetical protein